MTTKRKILLAATTALLMVTMTGCGSYQPSATAKVATQTAQAEEEMIRRVGMPAISNWQEKQWVKMLFELRDRADLMCYAYIVAKNTGDLVFLTECVGYGIPYSVQYTNPVKLVDRWGRPLEGSAFEAHSMPQADPNGLYMPEGLSATFLIVKDAKGKLTAMYVEPEIIVSPIKLH